MTLASASAATTVLWLYLGIKQVHGENSASEQLAKILEERDLKQREALAQEYLDKENLQKMEVSDEHRRHFLSLYPHWSEEQVRRATFNEWKGCSEITEADARKKTSQLYGLGPSKSKSKEEEL